LNVAVSDDGDGGEGGDDRDTSAGTDTRIRFDSVGLGFSARGSRIIVHYPVRDPGRGESGGGGGARGYGPGFDIGPIPEIYWTDAPNEITRERVAIWRALLEGASATDSDPGYAEDVRSK
jgi:hypothetical protein